ncbi:MAG: hypothetical protein RIT52_993 [Pseudomonadota bacterium]|jgi:hypothetical protein
MTLTWLIRMAKWARNPPSASHVKFVLAIVAIGITLWGIEQIWGWPEALRVNGKIKP